MAEGSRRSYQIGVPRGDHVRGRVVFVTVSAEGMTSGTLGSATEGEGKITVREERGIGLWAVFGT
jgi:hypothetical protein